MQVKLEPEMRMYMEREPTLVLVLTMDNS
jgi:hypothetical protein